MLDTSGKNLETMRGPKCGKRIPLNVKTRDWSEQRSFLKEKHQLETVLGPSKATWFDDLTEKSILAKKEPLNQHLILFDSPVRSPTVSQLIKNHLRVGDSPQEFYHSSPAIGGKNQQDDNSPYYTPDIFGHWQRPILGISPSPVLKDGSFFPRSSRAVSSLGLCNDSTLSWTNSLATPPRLEDPPNDSADEFQSKHKDPVRALFSPASILDTTRDSIEVLESTYEEDSDDGSLSKHDEETRSGNRDFSGLRDISGSMQDTDSSKAYSVHGKQSLNTVHSRKSMESWKDNFKRKLLLKSDSFGKNCSIESCPISVKRDAFNNSTLEIFVEQTEEIKPQDITEDDCESVGKSCDSTDKLGSDSYKILHLTALGCEEERLSPVFPSNGAVTKSKGTKTSERKREFKDSGVDEALSDFFDPPSGAVGKRNRKRKSTELDHSDLKLGLADISTSTPKNTVLHSILMRETQSKSSSGKKVRFSESVVKHSEHKESSESYKKKRKKVKLLKTSQSDISTNMINDDYHVHREVKHEKPEVVKREIKTGEIDDSGELCINKSTSQKEILNKESKCSNTVEKIKGTTEKEDVFSQISPSALEEMCDAAKVINDNDHLNESTKPCNSGDCQRKNTQMSKLQHSGATPKRFLYPSKQQIVVASPSAIFKFREDEKGDSKAKGIVMAIQADNIVTTKDRTENDKPLTVVNEKKATNEKSVIGRSERKTEDKLLEKTVHGESHCENILRSEDPELGINEVAIHSKNEFCVGFQSASGKGFKLSDSAVAKAKQLLDEDICSPADKANKTLHSACRTTNLEPSAECVVTPVKDCTVIKHDEEDFDFSEWCEDFDMKQGDQPADTDEDFYDKIDVDIQETASAIKENLSEKLEIALKKCTKDRGDINEMQSVERLLNNDKESRVLSDLEVKSGVIQETKRLSESTDEPESSLLGNYNEISSFPKDFKPKGFGFATASGKTLNFDSEKLRKAQEMLAFEYDIDETDENRLNLSSLQKADNSREGNTKITEEFENIYIPSKIMEKSGFATASGKNLNLSSAAFKKAENILKDSENCDIETKQSIMNINIKEQHKLTVPQTKPILPLHEIFKEELGMLTKSGDTSSLNVELCFLKKMKSKSDTGIKTFESTDPKIIKPSSETDKLSKPQGFRPFKAPKRSATGRGKYPPPINKVSENVPSETNDISVEVIANNISKQNNPKTKSVQSDSISECLQMQFKNLTEIKIKCENQPLLDEDNAKVPKHDVCDGIFTQMFADDMELDGVDDEATKPSEYDATSSSHSGLHNVKTIHEDSQQESNKLFTIEQTQDLAVMSKPHTSSNEELGIKSMLCQKNENMIPVKYNDMKCQGFKTAKGHHVLISNDALNKAYQSLEEVNKNDLSKNWSELLQQHEENSSIKNDNNDTRICHEFENNMFQNEAESNMSCQKDENQVLEKCDVKIKTTKESQGNDKDLMPDHTVMVEEKSTTKFGCQTVNGSSLGISETALMLSCEEMESASNRAAKKKDYDQNIILDEPVMKGFQTAKGTNILVSEKALESARNSLKETDENYVNEPIIKEFQTAKGTHISVSNKALEAARKILKDNNEKLGLDKPYMKGFQTAKGTYVNVSDKALEVARKSLCEPDEKYSDEPPVQGFQTSKGIHTCVSDKVIEAAKRTCKGDDESTCKENDENVVLGKTMMKGFQTAKGAHIIVSDKALETARNSLIETDENHLDNSTMKKFQTAKGTVISVSDKALETARKSLKDTDENLVLKKPIMKGFQTAKGKHISVSERALEAAEMNLKDYDENVDLDKPMMKGFQTAKGTHISVSEKALEAARKNLKDNEENLDLDKPMMKGFQTAKRTHISVSEKALEVARKNLKDYDENTNFDKPIMKGFQTAKGTHISVSEKALEVARKNLKDHDENTNFDKPIMKGFHTAKGKHISFSEKALEAAEKNVKDYDENVDLDKPMMKGFQTAKGTHISVSEKALEAARKNLKENEENLDMDKPMMKGFQTAKGTHISVSEKALEAARKNLKENEENLDMDKPMMKGFQTAKGTRISVSEKALEAARKNLKENEENLDLDKLMMKGFQTAKGTQISVSGKAFEAAEKSLKDNDETIDSDKSIMKGFQSAKGTVISVSDEALEPTRTRMKVTDDNHVHPSFNGFQTAKGTYIAVSDIALEAAKNSLKDETNVSVLEKSDMKGFHTATGATVAISANAFNKAKESLLSHSLDEEKHDLHHELGFQTAYGSKVHISEISLLKAREKMDDENEGDGETLRGSKSHCNSAYLCGFQTAKGNDVNVCDEALQIVQEQCEQIVNLEPIGSKKGANFHGFQTAKGSEVSVSEKALKYARDQLSTCVDEDKTTINLKSNSGCLSGTDVDAELDLDLPLKRQKLGHHTEKRIMHQSAMTTSNSLKRKPLRSTPEGTTRDRRHPGFRAFIPVRSCNLEQQIQRKECATNSPVSIQEPKSSFQTPYKKARVTEQDSKTSLESKDQINTKVPVFHCKSKPGVTESKVTNGAAVDTGVCAIATENDMLLSSKESESERATRKNNSNNLSDVKDIVSKLEVGQEMSCTHEVPSKDTVSTNKSGNNVSRSLCMEEVAMETSDIGSFSQDEDDVFYCNLVEARRQQEEIIKLRKTKKIEPVCGRLYQLKTMESVKRWKLRDVIGGSNVKVEKRKIFVTSSTAEAFNFKMRDYYGSHTAHVLLGDGAFLVPDDEGNAGKNEFYRAFLTMDGVDQKLLNEAWIYNHYRWIVWKLAAYEVTCNGFKGRSLTPENVMLQLKYRYDREIDKTERSCLKKIYERDDAASKRLVLCVSSVRFDKYLSNTESIGALKNELIKVDVELTDGWYKVPAQLDGPLTNMIHAGKITVGQKLCISGAELVGGEDACTPLEAPASIHLKININAARQAVWDSVLGYQKDPRPLCIPLVSLFDEGGTVGVVDVVIVRKYPIMYMEKMLTGGCVFRTSRDEERAQQHCQTRKQIEMEKLYNHIQQQLESEQRQNKKLRKSGKKYSKKAIEELMTGEEIHDAIESSVQPDMIQNYLTDRQQGLLYEYQRSLQEEKSHDLNMRVQAAWREKEEEVPTERNVTPVLKLRVAGCANKDLDCKATTILTVWRPAAEISDLKEGKRYKIYSLNTSTSRSKYTGSNVQVTATKQSKFLHREINENLLDHIYEPREVLWVNDIKRRQPLYGEFDFVGLIVKKVAAQTKDGFRNPDILYLADCQSNLLCVKFWNGFKSFGGDTFTEGACICISNLMDKSAYRNLHLPSVEATAEFTSITLKPQNSGQRQALEKLCSVIKGKATFKDEVLTTLEELLFGQSHNITPKKNPRPPLVVSPMPNSSSLKEENKMSDDEHDKPACDHKSPQESDNPEKDISVGDNKLNESLILTPCSQPRQKSTQSRLAKLAAYSTPDSLSPLPVSVPRSVSMGFKPPSFRKKLN